MSGIRKLNKTSGQRWVLYQHVRENSDDYAQFTLCRNCLEQTAFLQQIAERDSLPTIGSAVDPEIYV